MKLTQVTLILAVLLTCMSMPAQAAPPDRATAFVQALKHVRANVQVEKQAQQAYEAMMPELLAAKRQGRITEFELSPSTGVVKMVYRPSVGKPAFAGKVVHDNMKAARTAVELPQAIPTGAPGDVGGQADPLFLMQLYDNHAEGWYLHPNTEVSGVMTNAAGTKVAVFNEMSNGSGYVVGDFTWFGDYSDAVPGYTVTFKEPTFATSFTATVPNLKFTSINKSSSVVAGKGPKNKAFTVKWCHRYWDSGNTDNCPTYSTGTISNTGNWQKDLGTTPLRGGDDLDVYAVNDTPGVDFMWSRWISVPHMYCNRSAGVCGLYGFPFTPASIGIIHAGVTYTFSSTFDEWGQYWVGIRTTAGAPIPLAAGDPVSGTGVTGYLLPTLSASLDATTDIVSGKAPKNKYFDLWLYHAWDGLWDFGYENANASGNYSYDWTAAIPDLENILPGNQYIVQIYSVNKSTGNITDFYKALVP